MIRAALATATFAAAVMVPTSASAATTRKCAVPVPDGAGYYGLKVRATSCASGKALIRAIERGRVTRDDDPYRFRVRTGGRTWKCVTTILALERGRDSCRSGSRRAYLYSGA